MGNTHFCLAVSLPEGDTRHYLLDRDTVSVGRAPENRISISLESISHAHCRIQRSQDEGVWYVSDLGSKNGTEVNGAPVYQGDPVPLTEGDFVVFGKMVYGQLVTVPEQSLSANGHPPDPQEQLRKITSKEALTGERDTGLAVANAARNGRSEEDIDREYEEIAMNPVAAAVARATKSLTGR